MKKIILLILAFTFSLINWEIIADENGVVLNEKTITASSDQLDFLYDYNQNVSEDEQWYIIFLGKDKSFLINWLNEKFEHLDVSNSSWKFDDNILKKINESLISINNQKDYASYAIITDAEDEIVIPTSPIKEKDKGKFLDELEKKLITASSSELELQSNQRADFKKIESKIRASFDYKSQWIKSAVDAVLSNATKFNNSSKKFKILHYSVITKLNFLDQGVSEINMENIGTVDTQVHGTRVQSSQNNNPDLDYTTIKALRNTFYSSLSEYKDYEKLMLARVSSYKQYLEGKDLNVDGLQEGFGKKVYIAQQNKVSNEQDLKDLLELCNFLSEQFNKQTVSEKYEAIIDINSIESGKDRVSLLESIIKNNITNKEILLNLYPYYGIARQYENGLNQFRVYFSNTHLWTKKGDLSSNEVISENYNNNSLDFIVSKSTTDKEKTQYYYSVEDLITRYKYVAVGDTSNLLTQEILRTEQEGTAHSIAQAEYYDQYVALFGTDDAYLFIAFWSAQYARDLLGPYFLRQIIAEYGAMLTGQLLRQKALDVIIAMKIEIFTQIFINYYFLEQSQFNFDKSVENINKIDVIYSGSKALLNLSLKQEMALDCLKGAFLDANYQLTGNINVLNCGTTVAIAIVQRYAANHAVSFIKSLKKVAKDNPELFIRGWKQIFKDIGADQSQTLKNNIKEVFDELGIPQSKKIKDWLNGKDFDGSGTSNNDPDSNSNGNDSDTANNSDNDTNNSDSDGSNTDSNTNDTNSTGSSTGQKIDVKGKINNAYDDLNKKAKNFPENEAEIAATNNNVTDDQSKKFWQDHEMNVTDYLRKTYGNTKVGRQITVDIKIKGVDKPITCRVDNLVDVGKGKFKIVDAKSSTKVDLSKSSTKDLTTSRSTPNQKKFYDALENGQIESIKPRGANAESFFQNLGINTPKNLSNLLEKKVEFFVNDFASEGYNIFILIFNFN